MYAAYRPVYPAAAIDEALAGLGDPHRLEIADVGAGTGISTRLFADRGARVIAIEPNARMRAVAKLHPRVQWRDGTAERSGLADQSVDVAAVCQAFHWFSGAAAMQEFRRIARRRAVLLQYERDEEDSFTKEYGVVVRAYATDDTEAVRSRALEVFADFPNARVRRAAFASRQPLEWSALIGRAASASYLPRSGPSAELLRRDLHTIFDRYQRGGCVELALVTIVQVADW
jgi:SAM-dependent methyltransferase